MLGVMLAVSLVAACGDDEAATTTTTPGADTESLEDAELVIYSGRNEDLVQPLIDTFEEESGIEVDVRTLPFDTLRTVLQTQLRSGDGPDVFSYGSGPSFGGALADAGLLYDLTDAYEEGGWEVYDFYSETKVCYVDYSGRLQRAQIDNREPLT